MIILAAGTLHIYGFLTSDQGVFDATPYAIATLVGVVCLIIGLAVFEKFGWAGGLIMGPIETFGLSGQHPVLSTCDGRWCCRRENRRGVHHDGMGPHVVRWRRGVHRPRPGPFRLDSGFCSRSWFALTEHSRIRLHFVEWMGKFYDGSGRVFTPLGGRTLHTEGQSYPMDNKLEVVK